MAEGPRKGKMVSSPKTKIVANLREISPGVLVGPKYKPCQDPAMDKVLDTLKKDPTKLDRSGMGKHYKI